MIFSFPLLMTIKLWAFGFRMDRSRLGLLLSVNAAVVFGLSRFAGFRETRSSWIDDALDALAALFVGFVVAAEPLSLLGLLAFQIAPREAVDMVAVQAAPASISAIVANRQFQTARSGSRARSPTRATGEAFRHHTLAVGAWPSWSTSKSCGRSDGWTAASATRFGQRSCLASPAALGAAAGLVV